MSALTAVDAALRRLERTEPVVSAWACVDPDGARRQAGAADCRPPGPLHGVVLAIKDIFDTADQPTEYGSPIYRGYRPRADAAAVCLLRAAGAIPLGKTVTTEFALFEPGKTTNPHRAGCTPGGSSSGSAAAIAAGMADLALGTQTAGSIIRPASFCGVFGYKPSFGSVTTAGVKPVAPALDTVGWFARDWQLLDRARVVLTGRSELRPVTSAPQFALLRTEQWEHADEDSRYAVLDAVQRARSAGAEVTETRLPVPALGLADCQPAVMGYEAARSLAWEWRRCREQLSPQLQRLLEAGGAVEPGDYDQVRERAAAAGRDLAVLFGAADVLITPAACGEAPEGLGQTGDPRFARLWTLLGLPAVAVPGQTGHSGLPVGVQLVGRPGRDAELLAAAGWLSERLPRPLLAPASGPGGGPAGP